MAVQHRQSWTLENYKTSQSWSHSAGAEYRTATCSLCDTPVQLLVFDVVSASCCRTASITADYDVEVLRLFCRVKSLESSWIL